MGNLTSPTVILPAQNGDPGELAWRKQSSTEFWARVGAGPGACFAINAEDGNFKLIQEQSGRLKIAGNTIPTADDVYTLGEENWRWNTLYVKDIKMSGAFIGDIGSGFVTLTTEQSISGRKYFTNPSADGYINLTLNIDDPNNFPGITLKTSQFRRASWAASDLNCLIIYTQFNDPYPALMVTQDKQLLLNRFIEDGTGSQFQMLGNMSIEGHILPTQSNQWSLGNPARPFQFLYANRGFFEGPSIDGYAYNVVIKDTTTHKPAILFKRADNVDVGGWVSNNDCAMQIFSGTGQERFVVLQNGNVIIKGITEDAFPYFPLVIQSRFRDHSGIVLGSDTRVLGYWSADTQVAFRVQSYNEVHLLSLTQQHKMLFRRTTEDYTLNTFQIEGSGISMGIGNSVGAYPSAINAYYSQLVMKGQATDYALTMDGATPSGMNFTYNAYYGNGIFRYLKSGEGATRLFQGPRAFFFQVSDTPFGVGGAQINWHDAISVNSDGTVAIPGLIASLSNVVTLTGPPQTISGDKTFTGNVRLPGGLTYLTPENPAAAEGGQIGFMGTAGNADVIFDRVHNLQRVWVFQSSNQVFQIFNGSPPYRFNLEVHGEIYGTDSLKTEGNLTVNGTSFLQGVNINLNLNVVRDIAANRVFTPTIILEKTTVPSLYFVGDGGSVNTGSATDWRIWSTVNSPLHLRNRGEAADRFIFYQEGTMQINCDQGGYRLQLNVGGLGASASFGCNAPHNFFRDGRATLSLSENAPRWSSIEFHNTGRSEMHIALQDGYVMQMGSTNGAGCAFVLRNAPNTLDAVRLNHDGQINAFGMTLASHLTTLGHVEADVLIVNHKATGTQGGGIEVRDHDIRRAVWSAGVSAGFSILNQSGNFTLVSLQDGKLLVNKGFDDWSGAHLQVQGSGVIHGFCNVDNILQVGGNGSTLLQSYTGNIRLDSNGSLQAQYVNVQSGYRIRDSEIINFFGEYTGGVNSNSFINTQSGYRVRGGDVIDFNGIYKRSVQCNEFVFGSQFGIFNIFIGATFNGGNPFTISTSIGNISVRIIGGIIGPG